MIAFGSALKEQMKQQAMSEVELAKRTKLQATLIHSFLEGKKEPNLTQLASLAKALAWDVNELLQIQVTNKQELQLKNAMEVEINHIARLIPKAKRNRFVQAVKYLAECFDVPKNS